MQETIFFDIYSALSLLDYAKHYCTVRYFRTKVRLRNGILTKYFDSDLNPRTAKRGGGDGARVLEKAATLRELLSFTQGKRKGEIYITS